MNTKPVLFYIMKLIRLVLIGALLTLASGVQSQPAPMPLGVPPPMVAPKPPQPPVNYLLHIEWQAPKEELKSLELLTAEGNFELNGLQKNPVKINNNDVPATIKVNGDITALNNEKARLRLFLGRTVPYVTGNGPNGFASYSQMSVGLSSTFNVTFGKPVVIQSDENGTITVLVKRLTD